MIELATLTDDFGNRAVISSDMVFPYKGAEKRQSAAVVALYADYDGGRLYHLSTYETVREAIEYLKVMSCGTFKLKTI